MTTEEVRVRLRTKLEAAFGAEEASILMDRPPGGWNDLVTNQVLGDKVELLSARLDALEHRVLREIERRFRIQTWSLVAGLGVVAGILRV